MSKCIDPKLGNMLHAYELNQLSNENKEKFELHLMDCASCFDEVRNFESVSNLITEDLDVRTTIKKEVAEDLKKNRISILGRLREMLWPQTRLILKPAITYLVIVLLAYPAYLGIKGNKKADIREVTQLNLVPDRASSAVIEQTGRDILLTFVYSYAEPGRYYTVQINSAGGRVVYRNDRFSDFDSYQVGRLMIPADKLWKGEYKLIITNLEGSLVSGQIYTFKIE